MNSAIVSNKVKTYLILVLIIGFIYAIVYVVLSNLSSSYYMYAAPIAIGISVVTGFLSYFNSHKLVLSISGARVADPATQQRLRRLLEPLCRKADLPMPMLYMQDEASPNAFATGRNVDNAVICVTTGILQKLDDVELQGVLAHELSHIKNRDILLQTVASILVGVAIIIASYWSRSMMWGGARRSNNRDNNGSGALLVVLGLVFALLAPIAGQLLKMALSRNREYLADSTAADMIGDGRPLANALRVIGGSTQRVQRASDATENMYIVNPLTHMSANGQKLGRVFSTHPPIEERVKRLLQY